jgi:RHH-type transcriptional regulator, rel operon repressor / antitoxin RelB
MNAAISVRLPRELAERLNDIAEETEKPRSSIIKEALESYLEEYFDLQVALKRLYDSKDTLVSGAELRKSLEI